MFFIDIDLIYEILEILLDGSSGFSAPVFSKIVKTLGFQDSAIYKKIRFLQIYQGRFWILFRYPGVSKEQK